jgi:hypothetical protein
MVLLASTQVPTAYWYQPPIVTARHWEHNSYMSWAAEIFAVAFSADFGILLRPRAFDSAFRFISPNRKA